MIARETDLAFINRIANSDAVRPFIDYRGVAEPLDFAPAVGRATHTGIIFVSNRDDALSCFAMTGEREWQAHVMFAETCRGRRALETGRAMLDYMAPWADVIWGAIPVRNRPARWFGRQLGFTVMRRETYEAEGPVEIVIRRTVH